MSKLELGATSRLELGAISKLELGAMPRTRGYLVLCTSPWGKEAWGYRQVSFHDASWNHSGPPQEGVVRHAYIQGAEETAPPSCYPVPLWGETQIHKSAVSHSDDLNAHQTPTQKKLFDNSHNLCQPSQWPVAGTKTKYIPTRMFIEAYSQEPIIRLAVRQAHSRCAPQTLYLTEMLEMLTENYI